MDRPRESARDPAPPSLARVVGIWGAVWMGLGSILGTGVFVSLGIATDVIGAGVVFAVVLAALLATANGLSSAQLAAAHPISGGTYEYGHTFVHPALGFTAGWMFLAAKSASAATAALGCAGYLLHALELGGGRAERIVLALVIVVLLTLLVASGVRRSSRANVAIVSVTVIALLSFIAAGWSSVDPEHLMARHRSEAWGSFSALLHATALIFVAYTGYGRIATLGEEVRDPASTIPRAIIATLAISMLLYLGVAVTAIAVVGAGAFAASTHEAGAPLEVVARSFRHPVISWVVSIGAVTAMAGVLLNLLLGLSRVLLAMARRGEMPRSFAQLSETTKSPSRAVWAVGALIAALVLLGDVKLTWSFSAFTVLIYYGLTNLSALALPPASRRYPRWVAVSGLVSCLGLAFFVEWKVWLAGVLLIALGLLFQRWMRGR